MRSYNPYSKVALVCVVIVAVGMTIALTPVLGAPSFELDTSRIYMPDQLDELRRAVAYQECRRDPACDANFLFGVPEVRCSLGAGVDTMLREMVDTRTNVRSCNPFLGEIVWPPTGECVTLLTQGPCPAGFWVKLQIPSLDPVCEQRPCNEGQALMENICMATEDPSMCPAEQVLMNNEFGTGECDCAPGTIFHSLTNACYAPYSQGPCPHGQIIKVLDGQNIGKAACVPNPCPAENMVIINDQCQVSDSASEGTCYFLDTQGPCTSGILSIDYVLLEPVCLLQTETHSIFNLPNIRRCARGSMRDGQGRCRRDFGKVFGRRPPQIVTSRPGSVDGALCPKGQVLLGGLCYRLSFGSRPKPSA